MSAHVAARRQGIGEDEPWMQHREDPGHGRAHHGEADPSLGLNGDDARRDLVHDRHADGFRLRGDGHRPRGDVDAEFGVGRAEEVIGRYRRLVHDGFHRCSSGGRGGGTPCSGQRRGALARRSSLIALRTPFRSTFCCAMGDSPAYQPRYPQREHERMVRRSPLMRIEMATRVFGQRGQRGVGIDGTGIYREPPGSDDDSIDAGSGFSREIPRRVVFLSTMGRKG